MNSFGSKLPFLSVFSVFPPSAKMALKYQSFERLGIGVNHCLSDD